MGREGTGREPGRGREKQIICNAQVTNFVVNGGAADITGVELVADRHVRILGGVVDLAANGAWAEGKFTSGAYNGPVLPQTPKWMTSENLNYKHQVSDRVALFVNANFSGQWGGKQDVTPPYYPLADQRVVNFRAGVDYRNLELAIYGNNVTDDQFYVVRTATTSVGATATPMGRNSDTSGSRPSPGLCKKWERKHAFIWSVVCGSGDDGSDESARR